MNNPKLLIYKSSAGSGKTYTLVLEYLKLVLKKPSIYRSILAITFTNKATEEMKTRIVGALAAIASNSEVKMQETISDHTGIPIAELPERAARVLEAILHDYSGFAVSTIDSFFSRIVKSLARELHLPLRFDLELDMDHVSREISNMMFADVESDPDLRKWLEEYIFDKLDDERGWALEHDIHGICKQLFDERFRQLFPEGSGTPKPEFIDALKKIIKEFEVKMTEISVEFLKTIDQAGLSIDDFAYKNKGIAGYFEKIGNASDVDKYIPNSYASKAFDDSAKWTSKASAKAKQIIDLAENQLMNFTRQISHLRENDFKIYTAAASVLSNAYMAGIIGTLDKKLIQFRVENDVVLISDNNLFLRKAIGEQDAPFIYEKSGNKYTHFMLDEFQDTSDFQWQNLFPLIQNALGAGNSTLIVGDAKQSIYRWRGGNMQLLQNEIQQQLKYFIETNSIKNLDSNYRSREHVVNFNNRFFELAPHTTSLNGDEALMNHPYVENEHSQKWVKGETGEGYIKIKFFDNEKEEFNEETGEASESTGWKDFAGAETLTTINQLLQSGFQYKDIAILTRGNIDAKLITAYLLDNGIEYIISPESMQLNQSPKIGFLIDVLTFINDYDNHLALAHLVYYYRVVIKKESEITLHEIFTADRKTKLEYLPASFRSRLFEFRKVPLFDLIEELNAVFGLAPHPDAYIQRFSDVIIDYLKKNPANIEEFLFWWDDNQEKESCSVIIPSNMNAIRVMTIHKSKGLQFPVVIMPYADFKMVSDYKTTIWVKSDVAPFNQLEAHPVKIKNTLGESIFEEDYKKEIHQSFVDNLNLIYVAFTRAEEQLYVFSKAPSKKKTDKVAPSSGTFIFDTLSSDLQWKEKLTASEEKIFETGTFTNKLGSSSVTKSESTQLQNWISTSWKERLRMVVSKRKIASTDPDLPDTTYGVHFHDLVAKINSEDDFKAKLNDYVEIHQLDSSTQQRLKKDISVFIEFAKTHHWFDADAETLNEIDILLTDGTVVRPDRLLIKDKTAIVIDYKTGTEETYHAKQVQQYADVLNQMGFTKTSMFLVYPGLEKVVEVKAA